MLLFAPATRAESSRKTISESTEWQRLDSVKWQRPDTTKRWFHRHLRNIGKTMGKMNDIDTTYIEPQRYNFTAMIQNTNNFEVYVLNNQATPPSDPRTRTSDTHRSISGLAMDIPWIHH